MIAGNGRGADLAVFDDLDEIVDLVRRMPALFIRYSEGPDRDREGPSVDYESELKLPGLSVSSLKPPSWWKRPVREWVARRLCKYVNLMQATRRPRPWLLIGSEVGLGPDHEPLVADAIPVGWVGMVALAEAQRIYQDRFVVGRDSRCLPARADAEPQLSQVNDEPEPTNESSLAAAPKTAQRIPRQTAEAPSNGPVGAADSRCPFCFPAAIAPSQLLVATEHFYLLAPVGQIVEGFLAIMTHSCRDASPRLRCLDDIPTAWVSEMNAMRDVITSFYRDVYDAPVLFYEHGRGGGYDSSLPGGDFVFHPHLCALPGDLDIHQPLQAHYSFLAAQQFPTVREQIGRRPYIYVHTPAGIRQPEPLIYYEPGDGGDERVARLSIKALLVEANSLERDSAWRRYPGERELADLIDRFNVWYTMGFRRPSDPRLNTLIGPRPR
jgi:hypothetical protein